MKRMRTALAFLTAILTLFGCVPLFSVGVNAGAQEDLKAIDALFDYSIPGRAVRTVPADEFLSQAAGVTLSSAEKNYLIAGDVAFKYTDDLPSGLVSVSTGAEGFEVAAAEYEGRAENGATVRWKPVSATVNGKTAPFIGGRYTATFEGLDANKAYDIDVLFEAALTVGKEDLTALANAGYAEGARLVALRAEVAQRTSEYDQAWDAYNVSYAEYLIEKNAYGEYLTLLAAYNADKAAYDEYVAEKAAYEAQYALWQKYLTDVETYDAAYAAYETALEEYNALYEVYREDFEMREACREAIRVFETIFVKDSAGNMMYNTLLGPTVDTVIKNKDRLVNEGGVSAEDINNAGDATEKLRTLLKTVRTITGEKKRFAFYKENYGEIKDQFILLFSSLYSLCQNGVVRSQMQKNGKLERFYQFISQLYVISTGLDDNTTFSPEWTIRNRKPEEFLDENQMPEDRNCSDPSLLTYPTGKIVEPEKPAAPEVPAFTEEPQKTWTEELAEPVAPAVVTEPAEPEKPALDKPGMPEITAEQAALETAVNNGSVKERSVGSDYTMKLTAHVVRKAAPLGKASVAFYDYDRKTLLYETVVTKGSSVSYGGTTPSRPADARYTYTFSGWVTEDGKAASLGAITSDSVFYTSYKEQAVTYTVTFELHGETVSKSFKYGEMPSVGKTVASYEEDGYTYSFYAWTPELTLVAGDARYTARYQKNDGSFLVTFSVRGNVREYVYTTGQTPVPPDAEQRYIEGAHLYTFAGWSPAIGQVSGNAAYVAVYDKQLIAPFDAERGAEITESVGYFSADCAGHDRVRADLLADYALAAGKGLRFVFDGATVSFDAGQAAKLKTFVNLYVKKSGEELTVAFENAEGRNVLVSGGVAARLFLDGFKEEDAAVVKKTTDGEKDVSFSFDGGAVLLSLSGNDELRFTCRYTVSVEWTGPGNLRADVQSAEAGQTVTVTVRTDGEGTLKALYLLVGEEKRVLESETFVMPAHDVRICAEFEQTLYTVTFYDAEGNVILTGKYAYGQTPEAPADPRKEGNDEVLYTFAGWVPALKPVKGDVEYRPLFKEGANGKDPYKSDYNSNMFFVKVLLPALLVFAGIAAVSAAVIIIIIKKSKKHKKTSKKI